MADIDSKLCFLSATDALDLFNSGELSPVELLENTIEKAESVSDSINPFADKYYEEAKKRAKKAETAYLKGEARALEGIPLVIKDNAHIQGLRATNGSLSNADKIDSHTDICVERLLDSGANFFARSTCPEFCWLYTCHSRMWGVTRNPWREDVTCGGSSGGSAAALAAGATTLATGSDSTGSLRYPASQCGIVAFKPPYGRNPTGYESAFYNYDSIGPMARTVSDMILMQNIMSGPHIIDHRSFIEKEIIPAKQIRNKSFRIGYSIDLGHYDVIDDVKRATLSVLNALESTGSKITEIDIKWASDAIRLAHLSEEFLFADLFKHVSEQCPDILSDYVPELIQTANVVTADDYRQSLVVAGNVWSSHLAPLFEQFDALIIPTVSNPNVPAENKQKDIINVNGKQITDTDTAMTVLFNMFNSCPVLNVPSGITDDGIPVGIQIITRPNDDITAFQIGQMIENIHPWGNLLGVER